MSSTMRTRIWSAMGVLVPTSGNARRWSRQGCDGDGPAVHRPIGHPVRARASAGLTLAGRLLRQDGLYELRHEDAVVVDDALEGDAGRCHRDDGLRRERL